MVAQVQMGGGGTHVRGEHNGPSMGPSVRGELSLLL